MPRKLKKLPRRPEKARADVSPESKRLREGMLEWLAACYGSLDRMIEIAGDMHEQLRIGDSPLNQFVDDRNDFMEFIDMLGGAVCKLLDMHIILTPITKPNIFNPCDLILKKQTTTQSRSRSK